MDPGAVQLDGKIVSSFKFVRDFYTDYHSDQLYLFTFPQTMEMSFPSLFFLQLHFFPSFFPSFLPPPSSHLTILLLRFLYFYIMCLYVHACMYICVYVYDVYTQYLQSPEETIRSPETGFACNWQPSDGWELNSPGFSVRTALLSTKPSLQPLFLLFMLKMNKVNGERLLLRMSQIQPPSIPSLQTTIWLFHDIINHVINNCHTDTITCFHNADPCGSCIIFFYCLLNVSDLKTDASQELFLFF